MRDRHYLESSLVEAIKEKNPRGVKRYIKSIRESNAASLTSVDAEGKSFLFIALESKAYLIAKILLDELNDQEAVICGIDNQNRSLLHLTDLYKETELAAKIIDITLSMKNIKPFLGKDKEAYTILHHAVLSNNETSVNTLLTKLNAKMAGHSIIHQTDRNGNTPLHVAFKEGVSHFIVVHLINFGAKLNLRNNEQIPAIRYFSKLMPDTQFGIFKLLNDDVKKDLLHVLRESLINSEIENKKILKENYYALTTLQSLQALLIARHEFDDEIPVRNSYTQIIRAAEKTDETGFYPVYKKEEFINDIALTQMPLYKLKVEKAENQLERREYICQEMNDVNNQVIDRSIHELIDEDRAELTKLIDSIEAFLADLSTRPTRSLTNQTLAVLIPSLMLCGYTAIEAMLIYKGTQETTKTTQINFFYLGSYIFGPVVLVPWSFSFFGSPWLWKLEPTISPAESLPFITQLQISLLDKLKELQQQEVLQSTELLPTAATNIQDLEQEMNKLKGSQYISTAITIVTRLKNIVEIVRADLNRSNRPVSLFFPSAREARSHLEANENDLLLSYKIR